MNFKIKDVEMAVRTVLLDTDSDNESFTSKEICIAIRDGIRKIWQLRPEARYYDNVLQSKPLFTISSGTRTQVDFEIPVSYEEFSSFSEKYVNMEEPWREPLVNYVISMMYQKNDSDTVNTNLSSTYYQLFKDGIA